jgi:hypothetical protein
MKEPVLPIEPTELSDNGKQIVFKAENKTIIKYLLLLSILLFAISLLTLTNLNTTALLVLLVVGYYVGNLLISKRPMEIVVDLESRLLKVKYSKLIFLKSVVSCPLELVNYSFQLEVRAKGVRGEVFRLFYINKCIAEILPEYNGWSKRTINELYQLLCDIIPSSSVTKER